MNLLISKHNPWSSRLAKSLESRNFLWLKECSKDAIKTHNPKWIFFFHWSDIVPKDIYGKYRCAVVHTGNLPRGRGGSPLHNQILDGITSSQVNIIEMCEELDGGGIYCQAPITLQGSIQDIWFAIADVAEDLILQCINGCVVSSLQEGVAQTYRRKKKNTLPLTEATTLKCIYDNIRILDSPEYPAAYVDIGNFRLEFDRAKLENERIIADVKITKK